MERLDLYFAVAVPMLAACVFLGLLPIVRYRESRVLSAVASRWLFLFSIAASLVAWRWPFIAFNGGVNPDEAAFIADAHLASIRHVPWLDFDATTSGPFNVWPLVLAHALGAGYTYATARVVAAILVIVAIFALYQTARRCLSEVPARIAALSAICFFASSSAHRAEFAYYSSSIVPATLISLFALAVALVATDSSYRRRIWVACAGVLAGAIPLAKLQAGPIDAALVVIVMGVIISSASATRSKALDAVVFCAGVVVTAGGILCWVTLAGGWKDFLISYVLVQLWYIRLPALPAPITRGPIDFVHLPSFCLLAALCAALLAVLAVASATRRERPQPPRSHRAIRFTSGAAFTLVAAVYAVWRAEEPFPSHLLLSVPSICLLIAGSVALLPRDKRGDRFRWAGVIFTAFAALTISVSFVLGNPFLRASALGAKTHYYWGQKPDAARLLDKIPKGSRLAVWGWDPEVYVETDTAPGTRESFIQFQVWTGPYQRYYLKRYLDDLRHGAPPYFLDDGQPRRIVTWVIPPQYEMSRFPDVANYVKRHYVLIGKADGLRLYRINAVKSGRSSG